MAEDFGYTPSFAPAAGRMHRARAGRRAGVAAAPFPPPEPSEGAAPEVFDFNVMGGAAPGGAGGEAGKVSVISGGCAPNPPPEDGKASAGAGGASEVRQAPRTDEGAEGEGGAYQPASFGRRKRGGGGLLSLQQTDSTAPIETPALRHSVLSEPPPAPAPTIPGTDREAPAAPSGGDALCSELQRNITPPEPLGNTDLQALVSGVKQQYEANAARRSQAPSPGDDGAAVAACGRQGARDDAPQNDRMLPSVPAPGPSGGGFQFRFGPKRVAAPVATPVPEENEGAKSTPPDAGKGGGEFDAEVPRATSCDNPMPKHSIISPVAARAASSSPNASRVQQRCSASTPPRVPQAGRRAVAGGVPGSKLDALKAELAALGALREELDGQSPEDVGAPSHRSGGAPSARVRAGAGRQSSCSDRGERKPHQPSWAGGGERPGEVARLSRQLDDMRRENERLRVQADQSGFDEVQKARNLAAERQKKLQQLEADNAKLEALNRKLERARPGAGAAEAAGQKQKMAGLCEDLRVAKQRERKLREIHAEYEAQIARLHAQNVESEIKVRQYREKERQAEPAVSDRVRAAMEDKDASIARLERQVDILKRALKTEQRKNRAGGGARNVNRGEKEMGGYEDDFETSVMSDQDASPGKNDAGGGEGRGGKRGKARKPLGVRNANVEARC